MKSRLEYHLKMFRREAARPKIFVIIKSKQNWCSYCPSGAMVIDVLSHFFFFNAIVIIIIFLFFLLMTEHRLQRPQAIRPKQLMWIAIRFILLGQALLQVATLLST